MATKTTDETNGCTFQWKIENISNSWLKKGKRIESPTFIADALEGTKWSLWLYPMGYTDENYVGFYLYRDIDCNGPDGIEVNFQLTFLVQDGSSLKKETINNYFEKSDNWGFPKYETREKVFVTEREAFLLEDTLTVQCTIWNKELKPVNPKHLYARTVFKENYGSFVWKIGEFSTLKHDLRNKFKDGLINIDLLLNEEVGMEKKFVININSFDESIKYFSLKVSIVGSEGKKGNCGFHEYFADDMKKGELSSRLFSRKLIENKSRYLPIDVLFVDLEYITSTKIVLYEFFDSGIFSPKLTNEVAESRNEDNVGIVKFQNTSALIDDLKSIYNDAIFNDMELRTLKQTFPAHKIFLIARSSVFRRMFCNDMKEKNCGHIEITDLEDDTIRRMLLYIYTDSLEDLQLENAYKLYVAADKYQILSLKSRCASFLKDHLCPTKACDVLLLADLHHDNDLKSFVKDYILEHDKEIFGTQEWKDFMDSNLKLAADIMYRRVFQFKI